MPYFSFKFTRKALVVLNYFYVFVGLILILIGTYAKSVSIVTSFSVLGGIMTIGVFLTVVACLGVYGAKTQHQPSLFFYMIILAVLFIIQFSVAIACLGNVSESSLSKVVEAGWARSSRPVIWDAEKAFSCCGLKNVKDSPSNCRKLPCWENGCPPCLNAIVYVTSSNLSRVGMMSLVFSFTELIGVWLAYRFRNMRDPNVDPDTLF